MKTRSSPSPEILSSLPAVSWKLLALILLSAAVAKAAPPPFTLVARPAVITVDGDLADWKDIPFTTVTPDTGILDPATRPIDGPEDLSFRFAVAHDHEALYVAVEVTDDQVIADSCEPGAVSCPAWDDDAVEVFIDGNHNRAPNSRIEDGSELRYGGEFALVANGAANSDYSGYPRSFGTLWSGATNWETVMKAREANAEVPPMVYEFRLPWAVMGQTEMPRTIGFNISVQDDDDGGRRDHALYWTGKLPHLFLDESGFGTVRFEE